MNVTLYGASGRAGHAILEELVSRGHQVTAISRDPAKLPENVERVQDDLSSVDRITEIISGSDAVISAYGVPRDHTIEQIQVTNELIRVTERLIEAVGNAGTPRLIMVGGAGSLEYSPGVKVIESEQWPEFLVPVAASHMRAFRALRASDINWTYFSPPIQIEPGVRTGKFRLGGDTVIMDEQGKSRVSFEDYAIALVDELEKPAHERARFTIGY